MNYKKSGSLVAANDNDEFRFYVYAWQYPDGRTFYVGKGEGRREKSLGRSRFFKRIVAKIRRSGGEPRVVRLQDGLREDDAFRLERSYIKLFGRRNIGTGVLANLTDGGEGLSGAIFSDATRAKLSAAAKLRTYDDEFRAKLSAAHKGKQGRPHTVKSRAKMSENQKGKKLSLEHVESLTKAQRMRPPARNKYKGILKTGNSSWRAQININGTFCKLGYFSTPEGAAKSYDKAAFEAWGNECFLNFPDKLGGDIAA